jgi:NAD(P)-dependent dehydrogenase (short-subunit alcohol dehydrogenase family)
MKAAELFNVAGHCAAVTGAASGLGLAMAQVMADNGAHVTLLDADAQGLEQALASLAARGVSASGAVVDVRDHGQLRAAIDAAAHRHGRLDAVFANAGISAGAHIGMPEGAIDQVAEAGWDEVLAINLSGVFVTMQAAAVHMKRQRRGRIIVTSSIAGIRGERIVGYAYAATKAAVANLVRQAATELGPYDIQVNAIAPGVFLTNIANGRLKDPAVAREFARLSPMNRVAQPEEIAGLALLLASPAGSFISGAVIPIDGGATAS